MRGDGAILDDLKEIQKATDKLTESVRHFDKSSTELSEKMLDLTHGIYWLTFAMLIVVCVQIGLTWWYQRRRKNGSTPEPRNKEFSNEIESPPPHTKTLLPNDNDMSGKGDEGKAPVKEVLPAPDKGI